MNVGRAELATLRLLMVAVGISAVVSMLVGTLVADPSGRAGVPFWHLMLSGAAYAVLTLVAAAAPWSSARVVRVGAGIGVAAYAVGMFSFAPATGLVSGGGTVPWSMTSIGVVALATVVAGGERLGWVVIASWSVMIAVYRVVLGGYSLNGFVNDAQAMLSAGLLCVVGASVLRAAVELDAATDRAEAAIRREATERGRLAARARGAAFVHDEVLAALRGAADALPLTADAVRRQALRATGIVDHRDGETDWLADLRGAALRADARVDVSATADAVTAEDDVARALVTAARQALDNSIRHADGSRRRVSVSLDADGARVEISDDGSGFDPSAVAADRLGIALSIIGVMRAVPGGDAVVLSTPGDGTTVQLTWRPPLPAPDPSDRTRGALRLRMTAAAGLFLVAQSFIAIAAALGSSWPLPTLFTLAGVLAAAEVVRRAPRSVLSVVRASVTAALLWVVVAVALVATPAPITYGTGWFLPAAGFVLVFVALRGRPMIALGGAAAMLLVLAADASVRGGAPVQLVSAGVRTAVVVGLGATAAFALARLRRSTIAVADKVLQVARRGAWDAAVQRELDIHAHEVDRYARPLLERVARGEQLADADRALARAVEGRLRDGYRAGRLLSEAMIDAAMAARIRGVDVVLLDDAGDATPADADLPSITDWMSGELARAERKFVGRLLPADRPHRAQALVDGRSSTFGG